MRKIPRPFKMPWGKGMVIDEVSISSQYHEPTIQLLEFDNGDKLLRFCSYSHGRFSRSPLMIDEKDLRRLGKTLVKRNSTVYLKIKPVNTINEDKSFYPQYQLLQTQLFCYNTIHIYHNALYHSRSNSKC